MRLTVFIATLCCGALAVRGAEAELFRDAFATELGPGWSWVRDDKAAWRVANGALELRVMPGNLWGGANNVRNVLIRPAPDAATADVIVEVSITNQPTHQYEQANLAWYYDDSHMVKLGLELVDGQVCVVMGREEKDRTRTLAKIPIAATSIRVRLHVTGNTIRGYYLIEGATAWREAGAGDLPAPPGRPAQISLHCYQGAPDIERWARFTGFRIYRP